MDLTDLDQLFDELFPICRSIVGQGFRDSLQLLSQHIPLETHQVASGSQIFDWTVPREWRLNRAVLRDLEGNVLVDSDHNNLHVLNYSMPFRGRVSQQELQQHLYSNPELPECIPYVTSYYDPKWGLCVSQVQREQLTDDFYEVEIDTELSDGFLEFGTLLLPGESSETVLVSSYLCHPSLANNELSGPLSLLRLYELLKALPSRRYSYRFLVCPETIGAIAFLHQFKETLDEDIVAGIVLTCTGGPTESLSVKQSRRQWVGEPSDIDVLVELYAELAPDEITLREFTPTGGSDERQFCSPGVNWPVVQVARTVYGMYDGYHNSLDTKAFMQVDQVEKTALEVFHLLRFFEERNTCPNSTVAAGEPQLSKRNLYPTENSPASVNLSSDRLLDGRRQLENLLSMLSLADGKHSLLQIVRKLRISPTELLLTVDTLSSAGLIKLQE